MRVVVLFMFLCSLSSFAQEEDSLKIDFNAYFNNQLVELNKPYLYFSDTITFEKFKFYVGNFILFNEHDTFATFSNSYYLIDQSSPSSKSISLTIQKKLPEKIQLSFSLGIDSTTNSSGAMGGNLDPTKGMYWTWQSGYINFKLEGMSNLSSERKNKFQYHIGGYQSPFQTIQTITTEPNQKGVFAINMNLNRFFELIYLSETPTIMSPGKKSTAVANNLPQLFENNETE